MFNIRQGQLFSLEEILEISPGESYPFIFESFLRKYSHLIFIPPCELKVHESLYSKL